MTDELHEAYLRASSDRTHAAIGRACKVPATSLRKFKQGDALGPEYRSKLAQWLQETGYLEGANEFSNIKTWKNSLTPEQRARALDLADVAGWSRASIAAELSGAPKADLTKLDEADPRTPYILLELDRWLIGFLASEGLISSREIQAALDHYSPIVVEPRTHEEYIPAHWNLILHRLNIPSEVAPSFMAFNSPETEYPIDYRTEMISKQDIQTVLVKMDTMAKTGNTPFTVEYADRLTSILKKIAAIHSELRDIHLDLLEVIEEVEDEYSEMFRSPDGEIQPSEFLYMPPWARQASALERYTTTLRVSSGEKISPGRVYYRKPKKNGRSP